MFMKVGFWFLIFFLRFIFCLNIVRILFVKVVVIFDLLSIFRIWI